MLAPDPRARTAIALVRLVREQGGVHAVLLQLALWVGGREGGREE